MTFPLHTRGERGYCTALSSDGIRSGEAHASRAFRAREVGQQGLEIVFNLLYNLVRLGSHRSSPLAHGRGVLPSIA